MTPEKELILNKFNTLKYIDNNIASIIDNYIYGYYEEYNHIRGLKAKYMVKYGIKDGDYDEWYRDGRSVNGVLRIQTTYKDGEIHGEYKAWWSNKRPMLECIYNKGLCEYYKSWDRIGNILHK